MDWIVIDGAYGEGGGQIIRTSVSLAAITGKPVEIVNVRAKRSKPGLQAQHLTSVKAAAALCEAKLFGAELGSQWIRFEPQTLANGGDWTFEVGTAGATGLVAQTVLMPMTQMNNSAQATVRGGTHVPTSPTADYIAQIYAPMINRMGGRIEIELHRAGFFPKGGGEVSLFATERPHQPIDLTERGRLKRLGVFVTTSQLPDHVAERGLEAFRKPLAGYGVPVQTTFQKLDSIGAGAAVLLVAECENGVGGFVSIGERGKPMERVVQEAIRDFEKWFKSDAAVDSHLADQLVLPCALVAGESRWTTPELTEHLRTVLFVAQQFLPITYELTENADGSGLVSLRA
jgi:RNA 3'-terminal phosphate cyclase (ATP)